MKNFGKYLLLVLALLSIGGGLSYGNTLPEIKEELPFSSEEFRALSFSLFAHRENPFQEIPELSNKEYFQNSTVEAGKYLSYIPASKAVLNFNIRDLRRDISRQLFPKHFFL